MLQCIIDNRLRRVTRFNPFQRGYVAGGSCIEAAFFLYVVIQKAIITQNLLYAIFVDLSIAFPSAPRALIYIKSMLKGIPVVLVRLVMAIYRDTDAYIAWAGQYTRIFQENRGSGEGSVLGPTLFLILYDDIVEYLYGTICNWYITIGGVIVICLMFADDTVLFACNWEDCKNTFNNYVQDTRENGLNINVAKTVGMVFRKKINVQE